MLSVRLSILMRRHIFVYDSLADLSTTEPQDQATVVSRLLRCLRTLTLEVSEFQELKFATEILGNMPTISALECLNIVCGRQILASLAFDPGDKLSQDVFDAFKTSVASLPLRHVVFSPVHYRKNRRNLWSSVLDKACIQLKRDKVLKVIDRPLRCKHAGLTFIRFCC